MYNYVDFISDVYLGYIILCVYNLYIIKYMLLIFTYEWQFYHSILG